MQLYDASVEDAVGLVCVGCCAVGILWMLYSVCAPYIQLVHCDGQSVLCIRDPTSTWHLCMSFPHLSLSLPPLSHLSLPRSIPRSMPYKVGPVPQGVLDAALFRQTHTLLLAALDFLEARNSRYSSGSEGAGEGAGDGTGRGDAKRARVGTGEGGKGGGEGKSAETMTVYRTFKTIAYPRDAQGQVRKDGAVRQRRHRLGCGGMCVAFPHSPTLSSSNVYWL